MSGLKGFDAVRKASKDLTDRKNSGGTGSFVKELWTNLGGDGDTVQVRFLEQGDDVTLAWMHEYMVGNRRKYVQCLDQQEDGTACPGCEGDFKRKFQGFINVILRDAPQLKRDPESKRAVKDDSGRYVVDGYADEVFTWVQGITVFEDLADKDIKYKGLCTRDFTVQRKGKMLSTKYNIDPALDDEGNANATPMSKSDEALAADKYNLTEEYLTPNTYAEIKALLNGQETGSVTEEQVETSKSPFSNRGNRFLEQN